MAVPHRGGSLRRDRGVADMGRTEIQKSNGELGGSARLLPGRLLPAPQRPEFEDGRRSHPSFTARPAAVAGP